MIKLIFCIVSLGVLFFCGLAILFDWVLSDKPKKKYEKGYTEQKKNGKPCITFKQFIDWYSVNPAPWSWRDSSWPVSFGEYVIYKCEAYRTAELYWETYHDKYQFIQWVLAKEKQDIAKQSDKVLLYVMNHV